MSRSEPPGPRECPRCATEVVPERFQGAEGVTWLWRCACGWSSAIAQSGIVSRGGVHENMEKRERAGNGDDEPTG